MDSSSVLCSTFYSAWTNKVLRWSRFPLSSPCFLTYFSATRGRVWYSFLKKPSWSPNSGTTMYPRRCQWNWSSSFPRLVQPMFGFLSHRIWTPGDRIQVAKDLNELFFFRGFLFCFSYCFLGFTFLNRLRIFLDWQIRHLAKCFRLWRGKTPRSEIIVSRRKT